MKSVSVFIILIVAVVCSSISVVAADPLPWANPWDVGMNYTFVNKAFSEVALGIQSKAAPGAVGMVIKDGKIVARRAVGKSRTFLYLRQAGETETSAVSYSEPMLEQTVFDLASLTKMIATNTSVMILLEQGKIKLNDKLATHIPTFGQRAKGEVTIRQLLTHTSGLTAWYPFYQTYLNRGDIYRAIDENLVLEYKPGDKRVYSDIGFILLGRLVETVSGKRLDQFADEFIFVPLGMVNTHFSPKPVQRLLTAPTEYDDSSNRALKGIVHDENARAMGGVSGHAGLFSTADDLALFAQMLLNQGELHGKRILKPETVKRMLTPQVSKKDVKVSSRFFSTRRQLLGWWGMDAKATVGSGGLPSSTAFGHSGFTGTMMYIDPQHNMAAILLTNAVHPNREDANRTVLRRGFYINISKALVGSANVTIQSE